MSGISPNRQQVDQIRREVRGTDMWVIIGCDGRRPHSGELLSRALANGVARTQRKQPHGTRAKLRRPYGSSMEANPSTSPEANHDAPAPIAFTPYAFSRPAGQDPGQADQLGAGTNDRHILHVQQRPGRGDIAASTGP